MRDKRTGEKTMQNEEKVASNSESHITSNRESLRKQIGHFIWRTGIFLSLAGYALTILKEMKIEEKAKEDQGRVAFNHTKDEFLIEHFKQSQEEMRWRKNVEFRLLQFTLVFYSAIVAALAALYQSSVGRIYYLLLTIGGGALILTLSCFIGHKVNADHKGYEKIGEGVQEIWRYFELFEKGKYLTTESMLPQNLLDSEKGYGKGDGYKKTLWIIWIVAGGTAIFLFSLGIINLFERSVGLSGV